MSRFNFSIAIATASLWAGFAVCHGVEPARVPAVVAAQVEVPGGYVGAASCTAVNCHGGSTRNLHGSEHSVWLQQDRHAIAYDVLFNETSQRMAKLLNLEKPAHESMLCLNCHAPVADGSFPTSLSASQSHVVTDGVSCEACHGSASKWLRPHLQADWKSKSADQKAAFGFRDTKDHWLRAKLCADCHVGAAGRDVNHDLYAAGHPRLFFELSAFHSMLPAHWDRQADRSRAAGVSQTAKGEKIATSPLEAQLWALGQVASAEAALDLLVHRAKSSESIGDRPEKYPSANAVPSWPELAETACYACHHDLASPSWRQARGYSGRKPGGAPWGTWLFPLVPQASTLGATAINANDGPLAALRLEMSKPLPDRKAAVAQAEALQTRLNLLGRELNSKPLHSDSVAKLFTTIATDGSSLSNQSWDEATQVYLSLVALNRAHRDLSGHADSSANVGCNETIKELCELRDVLKFEPGYDSPLQYLKKSDAGIDEKLKQIRTAFGGN